MNATTTRDYYGQIAEDENGGVDLRPTGDLRVCGHCGRPAYYDTDDQYHHTVDAATGCFLIGAEDRPDDKNHPLVRIGTTDDARYDRLHIMFCEYQQRLRYEIGPERIAAQEQRENGR